MEKTKLDSVPEFRAFELHMWDLCVDTFPCKGVDPGEQQLGIAPISRCLRSLPSESDLGHLGVGETTRQLRAILLCNPEDRGLDSSAHVVGDIAINFKGKETEAVDSSLQSSQNHCQWDCLKKQKLQLSIYVLDAE
ncbi:hypothetical protein STEG23_032007, partial [Scotinomys teguina]